MLASVAASPAMAGMYDQPYALVEGGDDSETRKEARLVIAKIDGKSTRNPRKSDPIPPGEHVITVRYASTRHNQPDDTKEIKMTLEPCARYRAVAVYETKLGDKWETKMYKEPIGECVAKMKKAAAAGK